MAEDQKTDRAVESTSSIHAKVPGDKLTWGISALAAWILIFAAGLLIETDEYRHALSPRSTTLKSVEADLPISQSVAEARTAANRLSSVERGPLYSCYSYFAAMMCYTPLNLSFLALTSGLAGGCASNIAIATMPTAQRVALANDQPNRSLLLQEPPISAAFRGFVVYLCVIAGLYIVLDNPFKDPTAGQYIRLAGTLSIMAFLVGYDASRIEDWLRAIPGPGRGQRHNEDPAIPESQKQAEAKEARAASAK